MTSNMQPEPLRLADWLSMGPLWQHKHAAEALRRLHAENEELKSRLGHATRRALVHKERADELLEALKLCRPHMYDYASNTSDCAFEKLCAAVAKATGE